MDVLLGWLTTPGNLKRWRTESHAQLAREIVELMQEEGLAHRKAPYVSYKVNAMEKQYLQAKQWLLETGMHEPYLNGRATKEVRAHVERMCPHFKKLDPSLRGVPFTKKNAETIEIELDDSAEEEKNEEEQSESGEEDRSEEESDAEESEVGEESESEEEQEKRTTFRDKLLQQKKNSASKKKISEVVDAKPRKKISDVTEEQPKQPVTFRNRLLGVKESAVEKKPPSPVMPRKRMSRLARQIEPSPGYAAARKSLTTEEQTEAIEELVPSSSKSSPAKEKPSTETLPQKKSPVRGNRLETAVQAAMMQVAPSAPKRVGRPPKSATVATKTGEKETAQRANANKKTVEKTTLQTNGKGKVSQKVSLATSTKDQSAPTISQMASGKSPVAPKTFSKKDQTTPKPTATGPVAPKAPIAASATDQAAPKPTVTKRKSSAEELLLVKRVRTEEEVAANAKEVMEIERKALLKRVDDEEQQRREMHELERAKLKCELESKQVQLLFEKAAARKKLDQLGVPQEEIDRILPL
eukprot:jgi/Phyca11/506848/fgenesh2_kg.PHYCAscaffold_22_\